jgi:hypothetical protein
MCPWVRKLVIVLNILLNLKAYGGHDECCPAYLHGVRSGYLHRKSGSSTSADVNTGKVCVVERTGPCGRGGGFPMLGVAAQ